MLYVNTTCDYFSKEYYKLIAEYSLEECGDTDAQMCEYRKMDRNMDRNMDSQYILVCYSELYEHSINDVVMLSML